MVSTQYLFAIEVSTGKVLFMDWPKLLALAEPVVARTIAELPLELRTHLQEVPIILESVPSPEDEATGVESDTLGYFESDPVARIRLWLENIHAFSEEEGLSFTDEVRTTLLHEIGHVLGWDEDEVEERGLG